MNVQFLRTNVFLVGFCLPLLVWAQTPEFVHDPWEVRLPSDLKPVDRDVQRLFREENSWQTSGPASAGWSVLAHDDRILPSRMWGKGIPFGDNDIEDRALQAWAWALGDYGWSQDELGDIHVAKGSKHQRVFASQLLEGLPVLGSKLQAKFNGDKLVLVSSDFWPDLTPQEINVSLDEVLETMAMDMSTSEMNVGTMYISDYNAEDLGLAWLPTQTSDQEDFAWNAHPVMQLEISGRRGVLPVRYLTWVDLTDGSVVLRTNQVVHEMPERMVRNMGNVKDDKKRLAKVTAAMPPNVFGQVKASVHPMFPFDEPESLAMPHLELPLGSVTYFSDTAGQFNTAAEGDFPSLELELKGLYATVFTNGNTPSSNVDIVDGYNSLTAPGNTKEASAYRSTNLIHDHMRAWLPEFSDLDWSMTVNIDVAGECNAFYDGSSINFYDAGGGCNATSLIADVVYHEYGHAINDWFYQSYFYNFANGAMNEGYADFWAMSLGDLAEIGQGFYTDTQDGIRIYDEDPKVYPEDIVGEVHADGEIICGAWYDTHLLLGGDWDVTMGLFVDAFPGLQATAGNGQEGQAFTDVLLDVLQADDDDDDLMNGTPNAAAIIEGFAIHGITLFSYVDLAHNPIEFAVAESDVLIEAEADINFPYIVYFNAARLHYRTSPTEDFSVVEMTQDGDVFSYLIPGVPAGTVVEYYLDIVDAFGGTSATTPVASNKTINGNLPHYILVGVEPILINDLDEYSELGYWDMDLPTDNATTGIWEEAIPVGSMGDVNDASTVVAPLQDHTQGLYGFAYVTGLSSQLGAAIGENDVDGGHTTLISSVIDLTPYQNPVISYWRWYANAPASGANPASDWWQVEITNDGGNTWQYLENTSQQDISWRRKAFRVADIFEPTELFQMRFIASDSTTVGEYLDGGSLVEAALDDIVLYDLPAVESVTETESIQVNVMPNPAHSQAVLAGWIPTGTVRIWDLQGREVTAVRSNGSGRVTLDVSGWTEGMYLAGGWDSNLARIQIKFEVKH